jgi:hypothetical protein
MLHGTNDLDEEEGLPSVDHHVYAELQGGSRAARNAPLMPTGRVREPGKSPAPGCDRAAVGGGMRCAVCGVARPSDTNDLHPLISSNAVSVLQAHTQRSSELACYPVIPGRPDAAVDHAHLTALPPRGRPRTPVRLDHPHGIHRHKED